MNAEDKNRIEKTNFVPFLHLVADDLYEQYGDDLSKVTIIAPNKRANLFFNQYLSKHVNDKPIWTPKFSTIGDVFEELCPLSIADPIQQICTLYEAYRNVSGTDETLDKFYSWAELMKNDFEDIDNNLTDAKMLFSNITDLEEMKDFSFLSDNQRKAIQQYFYNFNLGGETKLKERFLGVWKYLYETYTEYRRMLEEKNLCYSGMLKRMVIEGIKNGSIKIDSHLNEGIYAVIGFNVLNETEKALFDSIRIERKTLFYWDYDEKYLKSEAGRFVTENIKKFGNRFENHPEYYRQFGTQRSVRIIKSPTENAQTRYVKQWFDTNVESHPLKESVVVLCNENVMLPVLHSIPNNIAGNKTELNVTMGYPLLETPIYSFVLALMDLYMYGYKGYDTWKYANVAAILKHPYTKEIVKDVALEILTELKRKNVIFPKTEQLVKYNYEEGKCIESDFLKSVFTCPDNHRSLIVQLMQIVRSIGSIYKEKILKENKKKEVDFDTQLYVESIFTTYTVLSRIHTLQERESVFNVSNSTLSRLIYQMLQQKSIPFHGEPAIGLQVMGLLETRNLDFRNVLMLSANEGQLPKQEKMASLIPYALRDAYGMTTIEKQVSLYSFYFYNLLQRAENVTLIYNCSTDGLSTGEMSRFMMQMQVESKEIFGSPKFIELLSLSAMSESRTINEVEVEKTPKVKQKLKELKKLSPSAINMYIDCPIKFYFSKVCGFAEDDEVSEGIDNATFGNIFHKCMEIIYEPLIGHIVTSEYLQSKLNQREYIEDVVDKAFAIEFFKKSNNQVKYVNTYNGEQLLNKYVIMDYVKNQIKFDQKSCPMTIIGTEKEMYTSITLNDNETTIQIGGIIDRCEQVCINGVNAIRISDYKTNATAQKGCTLESLFDTDTKYRSYNYLQALYYCEVYANHEKPDMPIVPGLMYVKTALNNRDWHLTIEKEPISDYVFEHQSKYRELLKNKLSEIFLSDEPFKQHESHCEYCDFRNYCKK